VVNKCCVLVNFSSIGNRIWAQVLNHHALGNNFSHRTRPVARTYCLNELFLQLKLVSKKKFCVAWPSLGIGTLHCGIKEYFQVC
jgi:hypothetical protein